MSKLNLLQEKVLWRLFMVCMNLRIGRNYLMWMIFRHWKALFR